MKIDLAGTSEPFFQTATPLLIGLEGSESTKDPKKRANTTHSLICGCVAATTNHLALGLGLA